MSKIQIVNHSDVAMLRQSGSDDDILFAMFVSTDDALGFEEGINSLWERIANMSDDEKYGRINFLMKNRHGSPFEHGSLFIKTRVPIAVMREWVRHRIGWSLNEMSGRYIKLPPVFYVPGPERSLVQVGKPGAYTYEAGTEEQYNSLAEEMTTLFQHEWDTYESLLEQGIAKEVARGVLGVYLMSQAVWSANPRSIMHFLGLRRKLDLPADTLFESFPMYEIDQCAMKVEEMFEAHWPITYKAFNANGRVAP